MIELENADLKELPKKRSLSQEQQLQLRTTLHTSAGLLPEDLPVVDILLEIDQPISTTDLINRLVKEQGWTRPKSRSAVYGIQSVVNTAFKNEGIEITNTLIDPKQKNKGSNWWLENVEKLLPKQEAKTADVVIEDEPHSTTSPTTITPAETKVDIRRWSKQIPSLVYLSQAEDTFIQYAAFKLRDCLRQALTNPIPRLKNWIATYYQDNVIDQKPEELVTNEFEAPQVEPLAVIQEHLEPTVTTVISAVTETTQDIEEVEVMETDRLSIQEVGALSLLVGSLNNTSLGIDENTVFEFRVDKEVIDLCNRWVWSLPFEHGETIKLYSKDYLNLRRSALEKVRDILKLNELEILEVAKRQENEDIENLLIGLSIGSFSDRQKTAWLFDQILARPDDMAWNDETGYISQLWREASVGYLDQSSSMVDVIEDTLQTEEYLEIIPVNYSKTPTVSAERTSGSEVRVGTLNRRDPEIRSKIKEYLAQIKNQKRMPSLVNMGQVSQYFKPAMTAFFLDQVLEEGFISPSILRNNVPYLNQEEIVILLYLRSKPRSVDITGLQTELRRIVHDEIGNLDKR